MLYEHVSGHSAHAQGIRRGLKEKLSGKVSVWECQGWRQGEKKFPEEGKHVRSKKSYEGFQILLHLQANKLASCDIIKL